MHRASHDWFAEEFESAMRLTREPRRTHRLRPAPGTRRKALLVAFRTLLGGKR